MRSGAKQLFFPNPKAECALAGGGTGREIRLHDSGGRRKSIHEEVFYSQEVFFVESLPMSASGKLLKFKLREQFSKSSEVSGKERTL